MIIAWCSVIALRACARCVKLVGVSEIPDPWPLRHLVLRTPRLELRPDDDAGLLELAALAQDGIHPPERMPFQVPWTDAPRVELGGNVLQYHWSVRATLKPSEWRLNFLVRMNGNVIGTQGLDAKDFAVTRQVSTGSWLGMRFQGKGIGTEMRAAVLLFAFDHLGAERAFSGAFTDNEASWRVSEKLGYREEGVARIAVRGGLAIERRLILDRERFRRPQWILEVEGLESCLSLLSG
ncbi:MAG: GNAT family N-acetyltransferase [Pseudonocardiaceae bacterium]|nr:GNAT family N-acetyltransferase [Pseudonocardiaceae bacterium]